VRRMSVAAVAALVSAGCPAAAAAQWGVQAEAPETKDRVSPEALDALVKGPMAAVRKSGLEAGQAAFAALLAKAAKGSVRRADLLTGFGVALYMEGSDRGDEAMERAALPYIEQAIPAYKAAFGPRHPEVAVALNSYATLATNLGDPKLRPAVEAALVEALSIRTGKLGPDNAETRATVAYLNQVRDPQSTDLDAAVNAAADALNATATATATATASIGDVLSDIGPDALWRPIGYTNPLIDEFVADAKALAAAGKPAVAAKYGLSVAALDEGIALLHAMQKSAYEKRRGPELRARALAWLEHSNRAPIAVTYAGAILDQFEEDGCKLADVDLLMQGSRDRDSDLWAIASSCTSSAAFATAIARSVKARPGLFYLGSRWTRGDWASELAAADTMLRPEFLAQVESEQRNRLRSELVRYKLMKLIYLGLFDEALRFGDNVGPAVLVMALSPKRGEFRATINGFALKESWSADSPAEDYAAALAVAGRAADARTMLDVIAPAARRKEARACLDAAKANCSVGGIGDLSLGALVVDQLLDDPGGDPYVLVESATGSFSRQQGAVAEALCRLLTQPGEAKECETARAAAASERAPEQLDADDRALWAAIADAGGQPFAAARSRYAALIRPAQETAKTPAWSRPTVDPAPSPFRERPIPANLRAHAGVSTAAASGMAALPKGFGLVRSERSGRRAVAVSLSTRFDPNGEVSAGGYWVHLSDDGGKSWGPPLYTGLAEHFPYVVPARSRLPLLAGNRLQLEVEEALIDTASISYPPVGLHVRRKRSGLYLDIPLADLDRDSDGDGLSDIAARHLLLDQPGPGPTPYVVGRDRNCPARDAETLARIEILKKLFAVEARALIEAPDKPTGFDTIRHSQPSGKPPIFLLGNPADWRCVSLDRPMIVYSEADQQRLRKFSPDFQLIELPPIRWNRAHTRGFLQWNSGWAGGTYRLTRNGDGWDLESISEWVT